MPRSIFQLVVLPYLSANQVSRARAHSTLTVPLGRPKWGHDQVGGADSPNKFAVSSLEGSSQPCDGAFPTASGSKPSSRWIPRPELVGTEEPKPPDRPVRIPQTRHYASLTEYSLVSDEKLSLIDDFPLDFPPPKYVGNHMPSPFPLPPIRPGPQRDHQPSWASHSPSFGLSDPPYFRTAAIALKRIIETHIPPAELHVSLVTLPLPPTEEEASEDIQESPVSLKVAAPETHIGPLLSQDIVHSAPSRESSLETDNVTVFPDHFLPPILHQLLRRGVYRLAVFHFQSSQEHYTSEPITTAIVNRLEAAGQYKLADRIRLSVLQPKNRVIKGEKRLRLSSIPRSAGIPSHYGRADLSNLPFPSVAQSRGSTPQEKTTAYYNSQIHHLLHKAPPSPRDPIDSGPRFPSPSPRLQRLSKLLRVIGKLEKDYGFVPDRQTANLVLLGWLQCGAAAIPKVPLGSRRMVERPDGEIVLVPNLRKMGSFTHRDLRAIFAAVSMAMDPLNSMDPATGGSLEARLQSTQIGGQEGGPDGGQEAGRQAKGAMDRKPFLDLASRRDTAEKPPRMPSTDPPRPTTLSKPSNSLHYHRHVKPFCEMMKRHMWLFQDHEGARAVVRWQVRMKEKDGMARKKREEEGGLEAWYI